MRLDQADEAMLIEWARGVVTGQLLVADLNRHEWQTSLALMMEALAKIENLGIVLVPLAEHASLHWINGIAPGCTFTCQIVAHEDLIPLQARIDTMQAVLYPEGTGVPLDESPGT